jgi:hypothetical protein
MSDLYTDRWLWSIHTEAETHTDTHHTPPPTHTHTGREDILVHGSDVTQHISIYSTSSLIFM